MKRGAAERSRIKMLSAAAEESLQGNIQARVFRQRLSERERQKEFIVLLLGFNPMAREEKSRVFVCFYGS